MWRVLLVLLLAVYLEDAAGLRFWRNGGRRRSRNKATVTRRDMLGCYEDSRNRVLNGRRTHGNYMTVGRCRQRCEKERKRFYGLEAGNACFCGNSMRYKKRKPLKECRMKCKGNNEACGGAWRILIYRNPKYRSSGKRKGNIRRKDMVGCYQDSRKRVLSGRRTSGRHMTVGRCRRRCERERKRFYGLEAGNACFCGNSMRYKKRKPLKECRMKCKGNNEACGGAWRILIYRNPKYRSSGKRKGNIRRKDMLGCYQDSRKRVLSGRRTSGRHMTVGRCRRRCERERKRFYGLEAGNACFCGNSMRYKKRKPLKECRMKCKGNNEACGGAWRILIYRNPKYRSSGKRKGNIRRKDMLGCYQDSRKRVLSGKRTFGKHMTVGRCRRRCERERKQFYGLEAGNECFCGNSMRFKKRKPLKECRMKCKGNNEACGGVWRILIYRNPKYRSSGSGFVGCYKDGWYRTLGGAFRRSRRMTVKRCIKICKRKRNRFAGVENGVECFCGNSLRRKKRVANSQCKMPCGGRRNQGCGGRWRIAIYKTNVKRGNNCGRHKKCHSKARCINGECRCNKGYTGDGVKRCYQTCTCSASGDPHYRTYDGQMIHFMGNCKYTLTKVKNTNSNVFNVEVKNEYRGRSRSVSYTRLVDVKLGKNTIRLHKKHQVYLNGLRIFLPFTKRGEFRIFRSGNKVKVIASTNDGDGVVVWDGSSAVTVTVPKSLGRRMIGLCGDCNGKKDDFRTKDGIDVYRDPKKFIKIGNSYTVKDDTDQRHKSCEVNEPPNKCTPELRRKAMDSTVCGFLNPEKKDQSPFKDCLDESPATSKEMFENCIFDFCTYYSEVSQRKRTICQSIGGYAEYCADLGIVAMWRSTDFCPLPCGENMVYDSEMSGCPASCVNPDSEKDCDQPPTEGCRCKEGFVLSDNKCVEKSKCGCKGADSQYYPLGATLTSSDCTTVQQCKMEGGSVGFKTILTKPRCGQYQTCSLFNGSPTCLCQEGYISDGGDGCLEDSPTCTGEKTDIKCESSSGNKVVCTVPNAKAVLHVRSTASDCKYGSTYGISGDGVWVSLTCRGTFSVCYLPVPPPSDPECLAHDDPLGKRYQGTMSSTELGYTCQKWSSQSPHGHSYLKTLDNNHCRNPDNEKAAWCYTTDPKKRWDYCHIPVCPGATPVVSVDECLNAGDPRGLKYNGYKNTTKSGKACQEWGRQRPHSHPFQRLADQSNFCRNPDNEPAPWCYTTSSATRWEFCSIPDCGECDIKQERSLQCEIVYKVTGKCYFASSALSKCKFTVRLNEYRVHGLSEAVVQKDGKTHTLRAGDTHKSCASFEMRSNTLYVVEKLCDEKCPESQVILN
ncbi:uncharacterized protein LOC134242772 isoform X2 [Saccostrea cucullata]|uniref:uncharacterized protein LOC134242772 isoform X2 n=1 Tax=Saccostrea cuccullata TaxID=36930 RepID=UPI002ED4E038